MTDFKAGDIVTFDIAGMPAWQGGQGVVKFRHKGTWNDGHYEVEVTEVPEDNLAISEGHTTSFKPEWLKLIRPAPKFQVGDWVEVTGWSGSFDGNVVQVEALPTAGQSCYRLSDSSGFSDKHLKPAEAPKKDFDSKTADPVNNPSHYTQYPVEVIELTRHMPFDEGNVVKYVARAPFKGNRVQDLKKARWYLDDAIKQAELEEAK